MLVPCEGFERVGPHDLQKMRHLHPQEVAFLNGLDPAHVTPSAATPLRLELAGVGQLASPLQGAWILSNAIRTIVRHGLHDSDINPRHVHATLCRSLLKARNTLWDCQGLTKSMKLFEQEVWSLDTPITFKDPEEFVTDGSQFTGDQSECQDVHRDQQVAPRQFHAHALDAKAGASVPASLPDQSVAKSTSVSDECTFEVGRVASEEHPPQQLEGCPDVTPETPTLPDAKPLPRLGCGGPAQCVQNPCHSQVGHVFQTSMVLSKCTQSNQGVHQSLAEPNSRLEDGAPSENKVEEHDKAPPQLHQCVVQIPPSPDAMPLPRLGCGGPSQLSKADTKEPGLEADDHKNKNEKIGIPLIQCPVYPEAMPLPRLGCGGPARVTKQTGGVHQDLDLHLAPMHLGLNTNASEAKLHDPAEPKGLHAIQLEPPCAPHSMMSIGDLYNDPAFDQLVVKQLHEVEVASQKALECGAVPGFAVKRPADASESAAKRRRLADGSADESQGILSNHAKKQQTGTDMTKAHIDQGVFKPASCTQPRVELGALRVGQSEKDADTTEPHGCHPHKQGHECLTTSATASASQDKVHSKSHLASEPALVASNGPAQVAQVEIMSSPALTKPGKDEENHKAHYPPTPPSAMPLPRLGCGGPTPIENEDRGSLDPGAPSIQVAVATLQDGAFFVESHHQHADC